jgi:hypothetical protein
MLIPIGADCETSGTTAEHQMLTWAMYVNRKTYKHWQIAHDKVVISPASMRVNKMQAQELDNGLSAELFDKELLSWINDYMPNRDENNEANKLVMVGFNVGSFDRPFLERTVRGRTISKFSHYAIDLNAILFGLLGHEKANIAKASLKKEARRMMIVQNPEILELGSHNALYDACEAHHILWLLNRYIDVERLVNSFGTVASLA